MKPSLHLSAEQAPDGKEGPRKSIVDGVSSPWKMKTNRGSGPEQGARGEHTGRAFQGRQALHWLWTIHPSGDEVFEVESY